MSDTFDPAMRTCKSCKWKAKMPEAVNQFMCANRPPVGHLLMDQQGHAMTIAIRPPVTDETPACFYYAPIINNS